MHEEDPLCRCQHPESEHHRSWFYGGGKLVEECEYFGPDGIECVENCQMFRRADG